MTVSAKLSEFAETTSMHGIAHINAATKCGLKVFWTVVVLAGIAVCTWYVYMSVLQFLEYPVLVQTEIKFDKLPFPAVTICNLNPIRASKLEAIPKLKELLSVCTMTAPNSTINAKPIDFCALYRQAQAAKKSQ